MPVGGSEDYGSFRNRVGIVDVSKGEGYYGMSECKINEEDSRLVPYKPGSFDFMAGERSDYAGQGKSSLQRCVWR